MKKCEKCGKDSKPVEGIVYDECQDCWNTAFQAECRYYSGASKTQREIPKGSGV
jgi:hypothetical protein